MAKCTLGTSSQSLPPASVVLELTINEARALFDIVQSVGGHPKHTRRVFADDIGEALLGIAQKNPDSGLYLGEYPDDLRGELRFQQRV